MFYIALVLLSVIATGSTEVSEESCRESEQLLEDLIEKGVSRTEVGQVHLSHSGAICFNESSQPSCCSAAMENVFADQAEELLRQKLEELMGDLEASIQDHVDEFDHFVVYSIHGAREEVLSRLRRTFGIFSSGILNEVNAMYLNMAEYFTEGTISGEEILDTFLESFYSQITRQFFGQPERGGLTCVLTIINETEPNFLNQYRDSLVSALDTPILELRAYSQSLRSIRRVFRRLKRLTITDGCMKNIILSTKCWYCHGHGPNLPPCPSLCTRVFETCTHLSDGVFFSSLIAYLDAMNTIAQRLGLLSVTETTIAIGDALLTFYDLSERIRNEVDQSCGHSSYDSQINEVPVNDTEESIQPFDDPRAFVKTLRRMYVLNNITESIFRQNILCENPTPLSYPCWTGTNVSTSDVNDGSPIFTSDVPPEVLREADALYRLASKLRKVSTKGRDIFGPRDDKTGPSSQLPVILEQAECPSKWQRFGSSCYSKTSAMTFTNARQECKAAENGDLVSIQSPEENEFIASFVEREKAWIGAWKNADGLSYWLKGEEWTFGTILKSQSAPQSPCVTTNEAGRGIWSTANCESRKVAVCEVPLS